MDERAWADFGQWLKGERQRRRLTQREVSALAGVSISWLVTLEAGGRNYKGSFQLPSPTAQNLRALADAIGVPQAEVFERAGQKVPDWAQDAADTVFDAIDAALKKRGGAGLTDAEREELLRMRDRIDELIARIDENGNRGG